MKAAAIVLAGRREGRIDPFARDHGVDDKCLIPIADEPLIVHVVRALAECECVSHIVVVGGMESSLRECINPIISFANKPLTILPAANNLVDSVFRGCIEGGFPAIVTTADNVLLSPASVKEFVARTASIPEPAAAVAMVRREAVLAVHPQGQRRFYEFSDGAYSNCNLYWIGDKAALRAAESFRDGGQFVKFPLRIVRAFGLVNLLRFRFGIGSTDRIFSGISRRMRVNVRMIEISDGACAIDVDHERSHSVASDVLAKRKGQPTAA
ncbi:spore coat biosynthesis protein F [Erythrobacter litoralis]|uniref:NTP transferase domain-containing protein n=1 Tax=Erythrobacter litoralis TaxID=39960 RepID=UPI00243FB74D|nr:spore coat biosynthesis protein F [Erythrobacter litoralis]